MVPVCAQLCCGAVLLECCYIAEHEGLPGSFLKLELLLGLLRWLFL